MRKSLLFITACIVVFAGRANAALVLNIPSVSVESVPAQFSIDFFFTEIDPVVNERLASFTIGVELLGGSATRFSTGSIPDMPIALTPVAHAYVFDGFGDDSRPSVVSSDPNGATDGTRVISASLPVGESIDISDNLGLVRLQ